MTEEDYPCGIDRCYFCGVLASEAPMTSDCQVGLLCEDSDSCRRRASAALPPEGGSTK